mmetsp:Transcript_10622/g.13314  ORF Transcript_10622/g.13314 Transcript_10622/m.13314 type:complete len:85 (+) Transcript_10622:618-872(+)
MTKPEPKPRMRSKPDLSFRAFLSSRFGFAAMALLLGSVGMYTGIAIREEKRLKTLENNRVEKKIEERLAQRMLAESLAAERSDI